MPLPVDYESGRISTCSVSCDTSDLKLFDEGRKRSASAVVDARGEASSKNIAECYQRKGRERSFGSKLGSIREEMREFCDSVDRFVDENRIVFKNGEVEGFWGRKTADESLQTDPVETRETTEKNFASEEVNELTAKRRWSTEERGPRVGGVVRKREGEDEARKNEAGTEGPAFETDESSDNRRTELDERRPADAANDYREVYDLMTLKTCPHVLPDSAETYSAKDANDYEYERAMETQREKSRGVFVSLFAELRCRERARKAREPLVLEDAPDSGTSSAIDTRRNGGSVLNTTMLSDLVNSNQQAPNRENIIVQEDGRDSSSKIEIPEDKFSFSHESPDERRNVDESDDDSFKTATSLQEDSQIPEGVLGSPEVSRPTNVENNCDKIVDLRKDESIDESTDDRREETALDEKTNNALREHTKNDEAEESADRVESNGEQRQSSTEAERTDSRVESLVRKMDRLTLERTNLSARLTGKRTREAEDIEVSSKRSFLIEEMNPGGRSEERKARSQISERCRQHLMQEAKKFTKKVSPLIDKCITSLIKEAESAGERSRYHKYGRRSLGETYPTIGRATKMDLVKTAGDVGERNTSYRDKYNSGSNAVTNVRAEKRRESTTRRTIDSESAASADDSGKSAQINV